MQRLFLVPWTECLFACKVPCIWRLSFSKWVMLHFESWLFCMALFAYRVITKLAICRIAILVLLPVLHFLKLLWNVLVFRPILIIICQQIYSQNAKYRIYENPFYGSRLFPWGRMDSTRLLVAVRFVNVPKTACCCFLRYINCCV
jgi:hypothetical protein